MAQHGGEMGEANDWCRLHGLALQLSVLPSLNSPHAVTCLRTQDPPLPPYRLTLRNSVFIFLYVRRLTTSTSLKTPLITGLIGERIHCYSSAIGHASEFNFRRPCHVVGLCHYYHADDYADLCLY